MQTKLVLRGNWVVDNLEPTHHATVEGGKVAKIRNKITWWQKNDKISASIYVRGAESVCVLKSSIGDQIELRLKTIMFSKFLSPVFMKYVVDHFVDD